MKLERATQLDALDFDRAGGLVTVVTQHAHTGELLMVAFANRAALEHTLAEGVMWYYSRSRAALWRKGDTSGNIQHVVSLHADCDADAVLARVVPTGPSCHTGTWSCFSAPPTLAALDEVIRARAENPSPNSYTRRLLDDANLRLKKLGEEAVEVVLACAQGDAERVAEEAADLLYHTLVACRAAGVSAADVLAQLELRRQVRAGDAAVAATGDTTPAG
jgi:phosphoribosyl-AMP cyclohydrolase / phosphoribosyl-ATP pyrophosphohydrolase